MARLRAFKNFSTRPEPTFEQMKTKNFKAAGGIKVSKEQNDSDDEKEK